MNERLTESRKAIASAQEALKKGAMSDAREWAERAAKLTPQNEEAWLILAAIVSPRESLEYLRKALEINPKSPRAKKGLEWAAQRLDEKPKAATKPQNDHSTQEKTRRAAVKKTKQKRVLLLSILLILMGCAVFAFAAWSAITSPALASILRTSATPQAQTQPPFAQVNIAKPAAVMFTAQPPAAATLLPAPILPTLELTVEPTVEPAPALPLPTETVVALAEVTSAPDVIYAEIIADTPAPQFNNDLTATPYAAPQPEIGGGERWIDVDLSQQRLYAYEGSTLVNSFIVSTGTWQTPTVTGEFKIWIKVRSQAMTGPGYYLPDVPFVMYFYKDYGLHGTYWHNNFGTPMSHGCVNLATPDAEWLYNFASVGTVVNVHD